MALLLRFGLLLFSFNSVYSSLIISYYRLSLSVVLWWGRMILYLYFQSRSGMQASTFNCQIDSTTCQFHRHLTLNVTGIRLFITTQLSQPVFSIFSAWRHHHSPKISCGKLTCSLLFSSISTLCFSLQACRVSNNAVT